MNYWLHPEAEKELGDAAEYYQREASQQIAEAFIDTYLRTLVSIIDNPRRAPLNSHGLRSCHFERFPYTVIYEEDDDLGLQIYAVAHQRRAPGYWEGRSA